MDSEGTEKTAVSEDASAASPRSLEELRLLSALVLLLGFGAFLALPFVLSHMSVVFLPIVAALVLTILLSPLADWMVRSGIPNALASLSSLRVIETQRPSLRCPRILEAHRLSPVKSTMDLRS